MLKNLSLSIILVLVTGAGIMTAGDVKADSKFERWVQSFWSQAKSAGISSELYTKAFKGITPDRRFYKALGVSQSL